MPEPVYSSKKQINKNDGSYIIFVALLAILFLYKFIKFENLDGRNHPIISPLFDMIIILAIVIILFYKNELN